MQVDGKYDILACLKDIEQSILEIYAFFLMKVIFLHFRKI